MSGRPEEVAKAVVLGLCKLAFRQHRRVFVINFSGTGDIDTHELTFDVHGLLKLLSFLKDSFGGGTDINAPLWSASNRIEQNPEWESADILIASDGDFSVNAELVEQLKIAKTRVGLQVTGVLIGDCRANNNA